MLSCLKKIFFCYVLLLQNLLGQAAQIPVWQQIQQDLELLDTALIDLEEYFRYSSQFVAYRDSYLNGLRQKPLHISSWNELSNKIQDAELILFGDDHANPLSQRNLRQLLTLFARSESPNYLVIEWIEKDQQIWLDQYLEGKISADQLRKHIAFDVQWPFSWSEHLAILNLARQLKLRVLAAENKFLSSSLATKSLRTRDKQISRFLVGLKKSQPQARILVAYGEYHLSGSPSLPHLSELLTQQGLSPDLSIYPSTGGRLPALLTRHQDYQKLQVLRFSPREYYLSQGILSRRVYQLRYYLHSLGLDYQWPSLRRKIHSQATACHKSLAKTPAQTYL